MVDSPKVGYSPTFGGADPRRKNSLPHGESEGELYTIFVSYTALLSLGRSIGTWR